MDFNILIEMLKNGSLNLSAALIGIGIILVQRWSNRQDKMLAADMEDRKSLRTKIISINEENKELILGLRKNNEIESLKFQAHMEEIKTSLQKNNILLSSLSEETPGNLNTEQVVSVVGAYFGKIICELEIWHKERIEQNHLLSNEAIIHQRYNDKQLDVIRKLKSYLSKFTFRGTPLNKMDEDGFEIMIKLVFNALLDHQYSLATLTEPVHKSIPMFLSNFQSHIMWMTREWCNSGTTIYEQSKTQADIIHSREYTNKVS